MVVKPCPFCGSASVGKLHGRDVACYDCGAVISRYSLNGSATDEIIKWNRRVDEEELAKVKAENAESLNKIKELEAKNAELVNEYCDLAKQLPFTDCKFCNDRIPNDGNGFCDDWCWDAWVAKKNHQY